MNQSSDQIKKNNETSFQTNTVKRIAELIYLDIDEEQAASFSQQFTQIIDYFQLLEAIDTNNVSPANERSSQSFVTREDLITSTLDRIDFFANVTNVRGKFVEIPPIFDVRDI
ncbi:Asp-tRNA(Asn)/Glu-tRNA(Gln) amidotransferase subunit GatC [Chloroflexota bacterium]